MTIYEYIAYKNPHGAKEVLNNFGIKAIRDPKVLSKQLAYVVSKHGKKGLYHIASAHPDLELITHYNEHKNKKTEKPEEKIESPFASAEGQAIITAVDNIKSNQEMARNDKTDKSDKTEMFIIGAVVLVSLALILKK